MYTTKSKMKNNLTRLDAYFSYHSNPLISQSYPFHQLHVRLTSRITWRSVQPHPRCSSLSPPSPSSSSSSGSDLNILIEYPDVRLTCLKVHAQNASSRASLTLQLLLIRQNLSYCVVDRVSLGHISTSAYKANMSRCTRDWSLNRVRFLGKEPRNPVAYLTSDMDPDAKCSDGRK